MSKIKIKHSYLAKWRAHKGRWATCEKCQLGCLATSHVLGRGSIPCDVLIIGEAPGAMEDRQGYPFVGPAGKLLDRALKDSGLDKFRVFISNILACRPPANRVPEYPEIIACRPRLIELIKLCDPNHIILAGQLAESARPPIPKKSKTSSIAVSAIPHPAWLLRKGGVMSNMWQGYIAMLRNIALYVQNERG